MKYKFLNSTHEKYCYSKLEKLECLYVGNEEIKENASMFIKQNLNESRESYKDRLSNVYYRNYFAQIINYYSSCLFSKGFSVSQDSSDEFYTSFEKNCDRRGTSLQDFIQKVFLNSLVYGKSYVMYDFPKSSNPQSLLEQAVSGDLNAYLCPVKNECLINWSKDSITKDFKFCVIKNVYCERESIDSPLDTETQEFSVWTMESGFAKLSTYKITYKKHNPPSDNTEIPLVSEVTTSFARIPILCLSLGGTNSIGSMIAGPCEELFARHSTLINAQNRSLNAVRYYKMGPVVTSDDSIPSHSEDEERGKKNLQEVQDANAVVIGTNDELGYLEPNGSCYSIVDTQLKDLVDEIYRLANLSSQSVSSSNKSVGRSGLSKVMDASTTANVLRSYGQSVRQLLSKLLEQISQARSEDVSFVVSGLDDFDMHSRELLLGYSTEINNLDIPSATFKSIYLDKMSKIVLDKLDPDTSSKISEEIKASVSLNGHEPRESFVITESNQGE